MIKNWSSGLQLALAVGLATGIGACSETPSEERDAHPSDPDAPVPDSAVATAPDAALDGGGDLIADAPTCPNTVCDADESPDSCPLDCPVPGCDETPPRRWVPPALVDPTNIVLTQDAPTVRLDPDQDAIITCEGTILDETVMIHAGRNIVLRDCRVVFENCPDGNYVRGVYVRGFYGRFVSFENVHVDVAECAADTIVVNPQLDGSTSRTTVQPHDVYFYNSRLFAGTGIPSGIHADLFQNQAAIDAFENLYIEYVTAGSWYSGFTAYNADQTHVRYASVTTNDHHGRVCTSRRSDGTGDWTRCEEGGRVHPSYMAYDLYAYEEVYANGCAPCEESRGRRLVEGTVLQREEPIDFTCLSE